MYDVIIVGAGPAGLASGMYAAKNKLKALIIAKELYSHEEGESYGGKFIFPDINRQLVEFEEYLELRENTEILNIEKNIVSFSAEDHTGLAHYGRAIIIATGREHPEFREGKSGFDRLSQKDIYNRIKVNAAMQSSSPGIFAAGSVISGSDPDIFIASAQGAQAVLSVLEYLKR